MKFMCWTLRYLFFVFYNSPTITSSVHFFSFENVIVCFHFQSDWKHFWNFTFYHVQSWNKNKKIVYVKTRVKHLKYESFETIYVYFKVFSYIIVYYYLCTDVTVYYNVTDRITSLLEIVWSYLNCEYDFEIFIESCEFFSCNRKIVIVQVRLIKALVNLIYTDDTVAHIGG